MSTLHTYLPICKDPLGSFESLCLESHRQQMCSELQAELEIKDLEIFTSFNRLCPSCSGPMYSHGTANPRTFFAICGEVTISLRRFRCTSCGFIHVPGTCLLPKSGVSASLAELICDLASKMSFEKANDSLFKHHGIYMSTTTFWACVQKEAENFDDVLQNEANNLFNHGVYPDNCKDLRGESPLIIGIDGGLVKKWRQKESFEIKCATIATGSSPCSKNSKKRSLDNRTGYAAKCSVDEFRQRISVMAYKAGYSSASTRIFVSDGASWIGKMIADYFPGAIHVLDMYHLKNKIQTFFGLNSDGVVADLLEDALIACNSYNPTNICEVISSWFPDDEKKLADKHALLYYVSNNAQAILNHKHVSIHGSGWVEKAVDLMVSRRLKCRGMSWTFPGCSHMLPLTVLQYNKQWNLYWSYRKGLCQFPA